MFGKIRCKTCGARSFKKINNDTYECNYCGFQIRKKYIREEYLKEEDKTDKNEEISEIKIEEKLANAHKEKKNFIIVKLMICMFLGYLGIHKFMEGKIASGLLYFFTYGFFGFGIIFDIVHYAKELAGHVDKH